MRWVGHTQPSWEKESVLLSRTSGGMKASLEAAQRSRYVPCSLFEYVQWRKGDESPRRRAVAGRAQLAMAASLEGVTEAYVRDLYDACFASTRQ